jgi:hypothetical protein
MTIPLERAVEIMRDYKEDYASGLNAFAKAEAGMQIILENEEIGLGDWNRRYSEEQRDGAMKSALPLITKAEKIVGSEKSN